MIHINKSSKKSQLIILTGSMFLVLLISISMLLPNHFQERKQDYSFIIQNIENEICFLGKNSPANQIEIRYTESTIFINNNYCNNFNLNCSLEITRKSTAPADLNLHNYSHFNYLLNINNEEITTLNNFTC